MHQVTSNSSSGDVWSTSLEQSYCQTWHPREESWYTSIFLRKGHMYLFTSHIRKRPSSSYQNHICHNDEMCTCTWHGEKSSASNLKHCRAKCPIPQKKETVWHFPFPSVVGLKKKLRAKSSMNVQSSTVDWLLSGRLESWLRLPSPWCMHARNYKLITDPSNCASSSLLLDFYPITSRHFAIFCTQGRLRSRGCLALAVSYLRFVPCINCPRCRRAADEGISNNIFIIIF